MVDLVIYITGLNLQEYLQVKQLKDQEERD